MKRLTGVTRLLGWNRSSFVILGIFLLLVIMIVYVWWPLAEMLITYVNWSGVWWRYFDWLLVGIFSFMTLAIMAGADLRRDTWILLVGAAGGLVIEAWGTQTYLWTYFTEQRPPLWIIPAWPIASLTIDRIVRLLNRLLPENKHKWKNFYRISYWLIFTIFAFSMILFVWPFMDRSMTLMACLLVGFVILTPVDHRSEVLIFLAGSSLGYFLEYWGTTRECWTYYTRQTPPFFAVLAHGMASVVFWRTWRVLSLVVKRIIPSTQGLRKTNSKTMN
ncbi:MAG TPA: hypothetical protein VJZ78_08450 [Anaerolineales bacterium]|nr:hypothetical protein [Anaerolineales bacterium]